MLWIYVEQDIAKLRKYGLRSSYEMLCLYLDLQVKDKQERAEQVLRESSKGIGYEETSFRNMLEQVSLDPYTQFLYLSWSGFSIEHFSPEQQKVFEFK